MEKPKFVYVSHINSTPEKVWNALTEPEFTRQYYNGMRIQSDWKTGAQIKFLRPDGGVEVIGEVLEINPPNLLKCSFLDHRPDQAKPEKPSRLTFDISSGMGITTLTITHDQFQPDSTLIHMVGTGWQFVACGIKTLLETGKPMPVKWNEQPHN